MADELSEGGVNAMKARLWCVHIIGPDDVCAAPDFDTAEKWAVDHNRMMREFEAATGMAEGPHWPETRSVVALWPWSQDAHAEDLPRSIRDFTETSRG